MTRINCIPPSELCGKHLVAEYRELPRVFALAVKAHDRGQLYGPSSYTLGKGHVRFFYTRLAWLAERQGQLIAEMHRRGYSPKYAAPSLDVVPAMLCAGWTPTDDAMAINRARISERLAGAAAVMEDADAHSIV
ncbi:MAG: pyrimidine dimer DNA glycosylase/endonuclease V [Rhizobium sp.]|nr:pyrimidine dimer DNA glycosylase/endonuclease V [Rhizobium sp.]